MDVPKVTGSKEAKSRFNSELLSLAEPKLLGSPQTGGALPQVRLDQNSRGGREGRCDEGI